MHSLGQGGLTLGAHELVQVVAGADLAHHVHDFHFLKLVREALINGEFLLHKLNAEVGSLDLVNLTLGVLVSDWSHI